MEEMYKQVILDAKAVRASAMANAKASLQEAFEPKIQEMIRLQLAEELEAELAEEEDLEETDTLGISKKDSAYKVKAEGEEEMDEASLEEILAELDELSQQDEADMSYQFDEADLDEAEDAELNEAEEEETEETTEDEVEDTDDDAEDAEGVDDDTKVIDITLGDLKSVFQSVMDQGSTDGLSDLGGEEDATDDQESSEDEEEIDLDEILAELSKPKTEKKKEEKKKEEAKKSDDKKKLMEALKTIKFLQTQLNEINVLNARLLYMNKIFKSKNLTESQKINVVKALDRANNTVEAKKIYETLKESLSTKKTQISESRGFASKPAGVAPKSVIVEADAFVNRWQTLAGIK